MNEHVPDPPPVLDYGRPERKPIGFLCHKQQALLMYGLAGLIGVGFLFHRRVTHVADIIMLLSIPITILIGNVHWRRHRKEQLEHVIDENVAPRSDYETKNHKAKP